MRTLLLGAALLAASCTTIPAEPTVAATPTTAVDDPHARWANRLDEAEARAALDGWRRAIAAAPDDPALHLAVSRACHFLAEGHRVADRGALLDDGVAAAEAGLRALSPEFARLRRLGTPFEEAIATLGADAAPYLYWWAQQRMLLAREAGFAATLDAHRVVWRVMERVEALDPATWYGGADRYFGVVHAAVPAIAGGDLAKSRARFDAAVARAPGFLETRLLYAVLYARAAGDDELYRELLTSIVEAPPGGDPEIEPEQELVRRQARALLR